MDLSAQGAHFIARREAIVLVPYRDGHMKDPLDPTKTVERWSIGIGCLAERGGDTDPITVRDAFRLFHKAVASRIRQVTWALGLRVWNRPPVPVLQQHVDAVCSGYFQSGSDLLRAVSVHVRAGRMREAADEFLHWDQDADGVQRAGLYGRRQTERTLFLTGDYGQLNPVRLYRGDPRQTAFENYNVTPEDLGGWVDDG